MDIALQIVDNLIQIQVEDGDLKSDTTLETAVLISLFTDQRVTAAELPQGHEDQRGWWGDMFPDNSGDKIGSKIWALSRSKIVLETLAALETYAADALAWMLQDGVASAISVSAAFDEHKHAVLSIVITRPTGEDNRFNLIWDEQEMKRA